MITSPEWVAEPPGWRLGLLQLKVYSSNTHINIYVMCCIGGFSLDGSCNVQTLGVDDSVVTTAVMNTVLGPWQSMQATVWVCWL